MPKLNDCHNGLILKNPIKKTTQKYSQNGQIQNDLSIMALWLNWTWGQKNHMEDFLDQNSW